MYILSFNLKEQLSLLLQNVNEVKQSTPALAASFTMCDSTRQNGLVTISVVVMILSDPKFDARMIKMIKQKTITKE